MNEHALARRFHKWLTALTEQGAPIWTRKIHGSQYSRSIADRLFCIHGLFVAVELKNPEDPKPPTPAQARELAAIRHAHGLTLVTHDLRQAQDFVVDQLLRRWRPPADQMAAYVALFRGEVPAASSRRRTRIR